jgi:hypothetical protein
MNPRTPVFTGESPAQVLPSLTLVKGGVGNCRSQDVHAVGNDLQALTGPSTRPESAAILRRQRPVGVGGKQHSVSILTDAEVDSLEDTDLQRYLASLARAMYAANAVWDSDGCFDAKGLRDRLWRAEQVALKAQWKRPHLVAQREAEIAARLALEPGATR